MNCDRSQSSFCRNLGPILCIKDPTSSKDSYSYQFCSSNPTALVAFNISFFCSGLTGARQTVPASRLLAASLWQNRILLVKIIRFQSSSLRRIWRKIRPQQRTYVTPVDSTYSGKWAWRKTRKSLEASFLWPKTNRLRRCTWVVSRWLLCLLTADECGESDTKN